LLLFGLESSPVASALAGLRANEARYFRNKYDHVFTVSPASEASEALDWVSRILKDEREIVIDSRPLEATAFEVDGTRHGIRLLRVGAVDQRDVRHRRWGKKKRAVGFKLSEGMEVPEETGDAPSSSRARKSKLAGVIRGSFFVIKGRVLTGPACRTFRVVSAALIPEKSVTLAPDSPSLRKLCDASAAESPALCIPVRRPRR